MSASWFSQNTQCSSQSQLPPVRATTARKCQMLAVPVLKPQLTLSSRDFPSREVAAISALCWQLQRTELEKQDKVSGEESYCIGKSRLLHKRLGFDCDIFLCCFKAHMMRRKKSLCKGLFLYFCIGAAHKRVRRVLKQECYIILSMDEAPCSPAWLERAISKLDGESGPPVLLFGYRSLDCRKD